MNDVGQKLYGIVMKMIIAFMELITNVLHQITHRTNQWTPIAKRRHQANTIESIWEDTEEDEDSTTILTDEEVRQIIAKKNAN